MKKILSLVLSLTLISAICAGVLAYINGLTEAPIKATSIAREQAAVRAVMPNAVENVVATNGVFVGRDKSGRILGYAAKGKSAKGYGGDIVLMVGFEADRKTVVRYKTLQATETPGLGMKLNTPEFSSQFGGKDATRLALKKKGGQIEAITSATITSKAVIGAVADAQKSLMR